MTITMIVLRDSLLLLETLSFLLREDGYNVRVVQDGSEVVGADVPVLDGLGLIRYVRGRNLSGSDVYIIPQPL